MQSSLSLWSLNAKMKSSGGDANLLELNVKKEVRGTLSHLENSGKFLFWLRQEWISQKPGVRLNICIRDQLFKA